VLALWGVMTRMRRPEAKLYPKLGKVIEKLTPLQKADLYAYGRVPRGLSSEEARELLAAVPEMYQEVFSHATVKAEGSEHPLGEYEGSFGASVRGLKAVLLAAASETGTSCVTIPKVFRELREFLRDHANHRWMLLPADGSFHLLDDAPESITHECWERWLDLSDWDVREALGLVDEARYLELYRKYVVHVSHVLKRERLFDEVTGELTDPDEKFMSDLERTMIPEVTTTEARRKHRAEVLSRIGAWALSHPNEDPAYDEIFPDYFGLMQEDYYKRQKDAVAKSVEAMLGLLSEGEDARRDKGEPLEANALEKARHAVEVLLGDHDGDRGERHTRETLKETLVALKKYRY